MERGGEFPAQAVTADAEALLKVFQGMVLGIIVLKVGLHMQKIGWQGSGVL